MMNDKKKGIDWSSIYDNQDQYIDNDDYRAYEDKESRRQEFDRKKKYKKNY